MADHAVFSPSAMQRTIDCPAWVTEATYAPVQAPSPYAEHGTMLHEWVTEAWRAAGGVQKLLRSRLDQEDQQYVLTCIDYIKALSALVGDAVMWLEHRVSLKDLGVPEVWGTADLIVFGKQASELHVVDWKFGKGVPVVVEDNAQLMVYAAGACVAVSALPDTEVHIHVVQPPLDYQGEQVMECVDLYTWVDDVLKPAIAKAKSLDPPYGPSQKACRFCPAAMTCKKRYQFVQRAATDVFQAYTNIQTVTPAELAKALDQANVYEDYVKQIRLYAQAELAKDRPVPGWKLVAGRSNRKWRDEKAAIEWMEEHSGISGENLWEDKFISPSKAEKLNRQLKKDIVFQALVEKPPGKPQLAKETDSRPAITPTADAADAFADYAEEE